MRRLTTIGLFVLLTAICTACAAGSGNERHADQTNDTHQSANTEDMHPGNAGNAEPGESDRLEDEQEIGGDTSEEESSSEPGDLQEIEREEESDQPDHMAPPSGHSESDGDETYEAMKSQYDITDPTSIAVLVNKEYGLPDGYEPDDLVKPDIPFVYEYEEVHYLRQEAAEALIEMFEASKEDGIELAGVSGYRSYAIQKTLYENYVKRDGEEAANRYSAKPGHSEHSTGLAMDVAGISGKCAANNCFANTDEAKWLAEHAHKFGFIIRYPEGKEEITGYQYEPWHLRYVGKELAQILTENAWTMEEFFLDLEMAEQQ